MKGYLITKCGISKVACNNISGLISSNIIWPANDISKVKFRGGRWGEEKNEGTLDGVEENGVGDRKRVEWNRQYYPIYMYDYMNGVNIHCVQP